MPTGVYVRTEWHREINRKGHQGQKGIWKGKKLSKAHKEKLRKAHKGKKQSKECIEKRVKSRKGYRHSEETRKKLGRKGRKLKGRVWNKGKRQPQTTGKKNPNWKGGISDFNKKIRGLNEYSQWRTKVFERDRWTCQTCHKRGYVEAHHIILFNSIILKNKIRTVNQALKCSELWDIDNGVTLCKECHSLTKEGGFYDTSNVYERGRDYCYQE